jgi:hypothetical protein
MHCYSRVYRHQNNLKVQNHRLYHRHNPNYYPRCNLNQFRLYQFLRLEFPLFLV